MNSPVLVSVLIPAYNAGPLIKRALQSVGAQAWTRWELLVIEDGSSDDTADIVREFTGTVTQSVTYKRNETNLGVSATRNRLMEMARGNVFAFLDADDWWTPEHINRGLETISQGCDICYCGFDVYDQAAEQVVQTVNPNPADVENAPVSMFERNFIQSTSLIMMRRGIYESIGGFDTALKVSEDLDFWIRTIARGFKLDASFFVTCCYVKHSGSAMAKTELVAEHNILFYRKHLTSGYLPLKLRRKCCANSLYQHARLIRKHKPQTACRELREAWSLHRSNLSYACFFMVSCFTACLQIRNRR